jgi:hypothetical protein
MILVELVTLATNRQRRDLFQPWLGGALLFDTHAEDAFFASRRLHGHVDGPAAGQCIDGVLVGHDHVTHTQPEVSAQ